MDNNHFQIYVETVRKCAAVAYRYAYSMSLTGPAHGAKAMDSIARLSAAREIEEDILALLDEAQPKGMAEKDIKNLTETMLNEQRESDMARRAMIRESERE